MQCEMCGSDTKLFKTLIEGTELNLCSECSRYGKIISPLKDRHKKARDKRIEEKASQKRETDILPRKITVLSDDYPFRIKNARERKGLTQKQLAKALSEKESLIHNIESGRFKPPIDQAKKFERYLKIKIVEEIEDKAEPMKSSKRASLTIGDMLNLAKQS
jgi:putative transcription factor